MKPAVSTFGIEHSMGKRCFLTSRQAYSCSYLVIWAEKVEISSRESSKVQLFENGGNIHNFLYLTVDSFTDNSAGLSHLWNRYNIHNITFKLNEGNSQTALD